MNLQALADELMVKQQAKRLAAHSKVYTPSMTPASSIGYPCIRQAVYRQLWPALARPFGEELCSIFDEGDLHQKDVRRELMDLGYEVVEAEVNFKDLNLRITGSIDGKLEVKDPEGRHGVRRIPVEVKSCVGAGPTDQEGWKNHKTPRMRAYFSQLQTYLFLCSEPGGLGLFKDKVTGLWSVCAVDLDLDHTEELLKRAETIRDAVAAVNEHSLEEKRLAAIPDRILDRTDCEGCSWVETCLPAEAPVDPLLLAQDEQLLADITERQALDDGRKRFKKLDDDLKARFKMTKGDRFIVGGADGFVVTKKEIKNGVRIKFEPLGSGVI
jgi:hypothetical protein